MRYSSLILLLISFMSFAQGKDPNLEAIEKGDELAQKFKESPELKDTIEAANKNQFDLKNVDNPIKNSEEAIEKGAALLRQHQGDDNPIWGQLSNAAQSIPDMMGKKNTRYSENIDAFIMLSFSIPKRSLETLVSEIQHEYPEKNVVLLFQGFEPQNRNEMFSQVVAIAPEGLSSNLDIAIDPTFFSKLDVKEVPFFAIKTKDDKWRKVLGDITFTEALAEAENHYDEFVAVGRTYPIIEPNLLTIIHQKIRETDWNEQINNATNNVLKRQKSISLLPSNSTYSYLVDGTSSLEQDVVIDGQTIAPAGTQINPLDNIFLSGKFAVIDINSASQLNILRYWKTLHNNVKVIALEMLDTERMKALKTEFGAIYQLDPLLSRRFGLEYVPSLVSQKGNRLLVNVVKHNAKMQETIAMENHDE